MEIKSLQEFMNEGSSVSVKDVEKAFYEDNVKYFEVRASNSPKYMEIEVDKKDMTNVVSYLQDKFSPREVKVDKRDGDIFLQLPYKA